MQVLVWILIILVIVFLIWLLKRWIKRIIFILILLVLAFFIYGIFNPSGAARLWYNVRTFPQRINSWISSGKEFLDYDSYKSDISLVENENKNLDDEDFQDIKVEDEVDSEESNNESEYLEEEDKNVKSKKKDKKDVIKSFPKSVNFVEMPELNQLDIDYVDGLTGYSKSDLLGVINEYLNENLDDDTDVLVTVEYEDDDIHPKRIILQTQQKVFGKKDFIEISGTSLNQLFEDYEGGNSEKFKKSESIDIKDVESENEETFLIEDTDSQQKEKIQPVKRTVSTKLTQEEQKEAEKIFGILF